jgi:hypothetical protein
LRSAVRCSVMSVPIIVLGEGLLVSANSIIEALHDDQALAPLISIAIVTVVVTAAPWCLTRVLVPAPISAGRRPVSCSPADAICP